MRLGILKTMRACIISTFLVNSLACSKELNPDTLSVNSNYKININPTWKTDSRYFLCGPTGSFDEISVKDPSIVYYGGKYHMFYTARNNSLWRTGYTSAITVEGLRNSDHTLLNTLSKGSCAPQVFWFAPKGKWYLIHQKGQEASFSTNTDISNPQGWTPTKSMGFSDGLDFWCISDGINVYCFYSTQDGTFTLKRRSTTVEKFPFGWSAPETFASKTFEAPHVYKNKADGKYYMIAEDYTRHFQLWSATTLDGKWSKISEYWAANTNLVESGEHWTDQVSHGEIIRSGINEQYEIQNINQCQMLIQGVLNKNYKGEYSKIPYMMGIIRNYVYP